MSEINYGSVGTEAVITDVSDYDFIITLSYNL